MRKLVIIAFLLVVMMSCGSGGNGELLGVQDRAEWVEPDPYGMVFIPMGSYQMGQTAQDVPFAMTARIQTVSIDPFWMDATEITNNEYRQFVFWVRDSIARTLLGESGITEFFISEDKEGNPIDPPFIDWETENLDWQDPDFQPVLEELFLVEDERFFRRKEVDTRKLIYSYMWVDLKQAALWENRYNFEQGRYVDENGTPGHVINENGEIEEVVDRSAFIMQDDIPAYPDTLVWIRDWTYSYNEPWAEMYFWHTAYDNYPVVGVTWQQAHAFSIWRTQLLNNVLQKRDGTFVQRYRLPTESEWEYAARGGLALAEYPWGGPYTRNYTGCFIANFKPLRGNYVDDGGIKTLEVGFYAPNDYGLFDMAGNVAEWTNNAFDESAYSFTNSLNPDYTYTATKDDLPAMKRKVIRGGSWKDIAYYLQVGTRTYEYQDTAKSFIGFRNVRSFMGRDHAIYGNM